MIFVNRAPGIIGSTTTEKLEGTSTGVDTVPLSFPPPSFPIPHYSSAPVLSTAVPIPVFPPRAIQLEEFGKFDRLPTR